MKTNRKKLNIEKWKSGATQLGIKYCFLTWFSPVCCPRWTYCGMCLPHLTSACALSMLLMYMQFTNCTANTFIHYVVFYEHTHTHTHAVAYTINTIYIYTIKLHQHDSSSVLITICTLIHCSGWWDCMEIINTNKLWRSRQYMRTDFISSFLPPGKK